MVAVSIGHELNNINTFNQFGQKVKFKIGRKKLGRWMGSNDSFFSRAETDQIVETKSLG